MATASELMSTDVQVTEPQDSLQRAAQLMQELDVGSLPVCAGRRLVGMISDRDIAVRGVAAGIAPAQGCVGDVMSKHAVWCTLDQDAGEIMRIMSEQQVRRLPVLNEDHELVGIVSLHDLALRRRGHVDRTVREISPPGIAAVDPNPVPRRPTEYR